VTDPIKIRQLEALLAARGWTYAARIGSPHRHWTHPQAGVITVSGDPAQWCDPGQLAAVQERWAGHLPAVRAGTPSPTYLALITQTHSGAAGLIPDLTVLVNTAPDLLDPALAQAAALHLMTLGTPVPRPAYTGLHDLPPALQAAYANRDVDVQFVRPAPVNPVSLQVAQAISRSGLSYREVARRAGLEDAALAQLADPFFTGQTLLAMQRLADALGLTVDLTFEAPLILPPGTVVSVEWRGGSRLHLYLREAPDVAAAALPLTIQTDAGAYRLLQRVDEGPARPGTLSFEARLLKDRP
jgi:predicted RNA binding protein YcfA (HicA-like mRNA interferase family)/transcriptional regulator with XRE-family HTH domain